MDKFVLHVPKWQGELSFSKETLIFVGVILLMAVGILFCFWGYKFFRTILFMGIGTVACYGSYLLVEPMTDNSVIRMFLTVSLTFLGVCFVYFLDIICGFILDKLRIRTALGKHTYLLAAPLGAAILGLTIYFMIFRNEIVACAIAVACLVSGLVFQHSKRKKQVRFKSYDDLLKLSRPKFDEDGLEYISLGAADVAAPAAAKSGTATMDALAAAKSGTEAMDTPAVALPEAAAIAIPAEAMPEIMAVENVEPIVGPEPEPVKTVAIESEPELTESMEAVAIEAGPIAISTEPESIKPVAFEPEPKFVRPVALEAELEPVEHFEPVVFESEPESLKPAVFEPEAKFVESAVHGAKPEPVESAEPEACETGAEAGKPVEPAACETGPEAGKPVEPAACETGAEAGRPVEPVMPKTEPEPAEPVVSAASKPAKISIRLESAASEVEVDILEDALFLKRVNNNTKERQNITFTLDRNEDAVSYSDKAADSSGQERKPEKKQEWKLTGGVALMAFGLGVLIANRTSKGGD